MSLTHLSHGIDDPLPFGDVVKDFIVYPKMSSSLSVLAFEMTQKCIVTNLALPNIRVYPPIYMYMWYHFFIQSQVLYSRNFLWEKFHQAQLPLH